MKNELVHLKNTLYMQRKGKNETNKLGGSLFPLIARDESVEISPHPTNQCW